MAVKYSLSKAGLEVYTTEPMTKESDESKKDKNNKKESSDTTKDTQDTASNSTIDSSTNFTLENGKTKQIDYVGELLSDSFEMDYAELSSNSSVTVPIKYVNLFFKGKKVALKKALQDGSLNWKDMETIVLGFVTELNWNKEKADIKISGMDKLMEVDKQFTFKQTKRSEIIKQIIEASGLKAKVDTTGLVDDVIDFTNVSSSKNSSGSSSGLKGGQGKTIDELVAKWVGNETNDLKKAKLIHNGLRDDVVICWIEYNDSRYGTPENCLENHMHLNCGDTAILTTACMLSGGLNAYIALRCDSKHYVTVIEIGGEKYYSDLTGSTGVPSTRQFNEVWEDNYCFEKYGNGTRI